MTHLNIKKSIILLVSIAFILCLTTSCEDTRMHNMVDDQVYVLNPEIVEENMYLWNDYTYNLFVIKSGVGQQVANIELLVNEESLSDYNSKHKTKYLLLPSDCYDIASTQMSINKDEYRNSFTIIFNTKKIFELQNTDLKQQYILPCEIRMLDSAITIVKNKNTSLIKPIITPPYN